MTQNRFLKGSTDEAKNSIKRKNVRTWLCQISQEKTLEFLDTWSKTQGKRQMISRS